MYIVVLTVVHMTCPHLQSLKKIGVLLWKVVVTSMLPLRIFLNSDSVGYFHSIIKQSKNQKTGHRHLLKILEISKAIHVLNGMETPGKDIPNSWLKN